MLPCDICPNILPAPSSRSLFPALGISLPPPAAEKSYSLRTTSESLFVLLTNGSDRLTVPPREDQSIGGRMGIVVWLIVGGVCGWLASIIMRTDARQGLLMNIIVGIVG